MAEEVVIKVGVDATPATNSLKALKAELKAAQSAALNGDGKAAKRVAELKDKMEDLADSVKTLKGSGVERANASFSQLGEGLRNFDFDKIKTGFKGIGAAMKAVPIFLLVEGVMYLVNNFKELSQGTGVLAKSLQFVGKIIDVIVDSIYFLTDAIGLTNSALDEMGEKAVENSEKSKAALDAQTAAFDRQMKVAQAAGKSTVELEKAKQKAIIDTNMAIVNQIAAFVRAGGELDEEKKKILTASIEALKNAKTEEKIIDIKAKEGEKKRNEEATKRLEEKHEKERQDLIKQQEAAFKAAKDEEAWQDASLEYLKKTDALKLAQQEEYNKAELDAKGSVFNDTVALGAKAYEEDKKNFEASEAAKNEALNKSLDAAKGLSEAFFAFQLNGAKGNAAKELQIRKQMFAVDKAFNVARAVQDGIRSVQAALTIPPPGGQILAGVNAAIAAANVAKILATKFDGGGAASAVSDLGSAGSNVSTAAPVVNTIAPTTQTSTTTTLLGEDGQNMGQRVYVLESDITKSQARIAKLNEQATV